MVFMICALGRWILKKCLGQDRPKKTCPLSVVRGQKQPEMAT